MKNLIQYRYNCTEAMFEYLKNKDIEKLISILKNCEEHYRKEIECTNPDLGMWFRFGSDDTLTNTIGDIELNINLPHGHPNYKFLIERFKLVIGLNTDVELMIYFS